MHSFPRLNLSPFTENQFFNFNTLRICSLLMHEQFSIYFTSILIAKCVNTKRIRRTILYYDKFMRKPMPIFKVLLYITHTHTYIIKASFKKGKCDFLWNWNFIVKQKKIMNILRERLAINCCIPIRCGFPYCSYVILKNISLYFLFIYILLMGYVRLYDHLLPCRINI